MPICISPVDVGFDRVVTKTFENVPPLSAVKDINMRKRLLTCKTAFDSEFFKGRETLETLVASA